MPDIAIRSPLAPHVFGNQFRLGFVGVQSPRPHECIVVWWRERQWLLGSSCVGEHDPGKQAQGQAPPAMNVQGVSGPPGSAPCAPGCVGLARAAEMGIFVHRRAGHAAHIAPAIRWPTDWLCFVKGIITELIIRPKRSQVLVSRVIGCAVKRCWSTAGVYPPGNWFAPPGSNQSSSGGNETAEASDVEGRKGDLASVQVVT